MHGVEAWTWRCGDGGGSETASPLGPSEVRTARPPGTLALQSFNGTGSWSTPKITSAPAARAPAEKPPNLVLMLVLARVRFSVRVEVRVRARARVRVRVRIGSQPSKEVNYFHFLFLMPQKRVSNLA